MRLALYYYKQIINNKAARFLATALLFYLLWSLVYSWILGSPFSIGISEILGRTSGIVYSLLGHEVAWHDQRLIVNDEYFIRIGESCNGLQFFGMFAAFVLAFPAKIKQKLLFLPFGILLIHTLNTIRVQFLVANLMYFSSSFDFNHKVTFNVIVYGVVLLAWVLWAKRITFSDENS